MLFPWYKARRFDYIQQQALKAWEEAILSGEITPNITNNSNGSWSVSTASLGDFVNEDGVWEENINPTFNLNYLLNNTEGIITIEKINLKSVILKSATKHNLDISVCAVLSSRTMGQTGNYVLAGHYSRIYGRHFNRITSYAVTKLRR